VSDDRELMRTAIEREGEAHRAALRGDAPGSAVAYARAVEAYRASWEAAGPAAFGRLVGLVKAAVLGGAGADEAAAYVRAAVGDETARESATAAYARAIAALVAGDDAEAAGWAEVMRGGPSEAFARTGAALGAIAGGDAAAYAQALGAIVADFESRAEHLTGVAFADTAALLETLAAPRGLAVRPASTVLAPLA
jgi:hypothetical protein